MTPLTFEQALKRLAEKEPEKLWDDDRAFESSQDDIDEILALIGWTYGVMQSLDNKGNVVGWDYEARSKEGVWCIGQDEYPTKLEAAKAALIEVVKREYL